MARISFHIGKTIAIVWLFFANLYSIAQTPQLLKDINNIPDSQQDSYPLGHIGTTFYYAYNDGIHGLELWKSDGTAAGTVLVKDMYPGINSGLGTDPIQGFGNTYPVIINNIIYFIARNTDNNWEVWKTDGTTAGTTMLKDVNDDPFSIKTPAYLTNVNGTLFFVSYTDTYGSELWKSDGTTAGTVMVKDINVGYSSAFDLSSFLAIGGTLYFVADDGTTGYDALWKTDGTTTGTVLVKDLTPTYQYSSQRIKQLTNVNGVIFFAGYDDMNGSELWKSNGTTAGTLLVKDIKTGSEDGIDQALGILTNVNGTLFFTADDGVSGPELWKSDGTTAGTVLVKDIEPGSVGVLPSDFQVINNSTLVFIGYNSTTGGELWKTDGTTAGTQLIKDINVGSNFCCYFNSWQSFANTGSMLFFTGQTSNGDIELWKTDGTTAGTVLIKDIYDGTTGSYPTIYNATGAIFLFATNASNGRELWKTNGTAAGTILIKDVFLGTQSAVPFNVTLIGSTIYFWANDGVHGHELWKSDGTTAGTQLVKDIKVGSSSSYNSGTQNPFVHLNNVIYFQADGGSGQAGLWKSDGTEAGTTLVKAFNNMNSEVVKMGSFIYFFITEGWGYNELWKSDGTTAGTVKVKDVWVWPGGTGSNYKTFIVIGSTLYFSALDFNTNVKSLWKSDGTTNGTVLIKSFGDYGPYQFTDFNGTLFFVGDGTEGNELWKSDGTTAGTQLVKDIYIGSSSSGIREITPVNSTLYFIAENADYRAEIWKTDGTTAGTTIIDIVSGYYGSEPNELTNINGTLFFKANVGGYGSELWKTTGTVAGSTMIKDIYTGSSSSEISSITNVNNVAYFVANDGVHNFELWKSDGTVAGTTLVQDLNTGYYIGAAYINFFLGINGDFLYNANGTLYFTGNDGFAKYELFKISTSEPCLQNLVLESTKDDISLGDITHRAMQTNGIITATNKVTGVNTRATYQARQIVLNPGFKAEAGTVFTVQVGGCN